MDVLEESNCYILHHKVIVIDARTVLTGSYNFTGSAEKDNDENLVIVGTILIWRASISTSSSGCMRRRRHPRTAAS